MFFMDNLGYKSFKNKLYKLNSRNELYGLLGLSKVYFDNPNFNTQLNKNENDFI